MRFNLSLIIFVCFLSFSSKGQTNEVVSRDSIDTILSLSKIKDSSDLVLVELAIETSKVLKYEQGIKAGVLKKIYYLRSQNLMNEGISFLLDECEYSKPIVSDLVMTHFYDELGRLYLRKDDYVNSQNWFYKSLEIREKHQADTLLAISYRRIGVLYGTQENDTLAAFYFEKQLKKSIEINKLRWVYFALINLSVSKISLEKFEEAINHLLRALELNINNNYGKSSLARVYNNLGWAHEGISNYDSSKYYYKKSLSLRIENDSKQIAYSYNNLGFVYLLDKKLDSAKVYLQLAIEEAEKLKYKSLLIKVYSNISRTYYELKEYNKAYLYLYHYDTINRSLFTETKSKQIAELQTKYETEKKDQVIKLQQAEINLTTVQKERLMYILLLSVGFTIIIIYIFTQRQRAVKKLRKKETELHTQEVGKLIHEQELKSINSMLEGEEKERKRIAEDLHDRVGSMLSAMKLQSDPSNEKMVGLLDETADEVRRISHNLETQVLNRFGLAAALEDLAEKIKNSGKVEFELHHLDLDERLDNKIEINTYRIVQELISNALKHSQATVITTQVNCVADQLIVMVEDNGIGFDSLVVKKLGGMGLNNVASRTFELNGNFNVDSNKGQGTTITVEIPL